MDIDVGGLTISVDLNTGSAIANIGNLQGALQKAAYRAQELEAEFTAGTLASDDLAKHLASLASANQQLAAMLQASEAATKGTAAAMVAASNAPLAQTLKAAQASAIGMTASVTSATAGVRAFGDATRRAGGGATGLLVFAQVADDIQYGFRAVVNQVPQVGQAIGQAMGMSAQAAMNLAGAFGVVAVGINQLINHWGDLTDAMGMTVLGSHTEEMDHLAAATGRTADQTARLNELKREAKTIEKLDDSRPEAEAKRAKAVEKAIGEGSEAALVKGLAESRNPGGFGSHMDVEEKERYAQMKRDRDALAAAGHSTGDYDQALEGMMDAARERAIGEVKADLAAAVNDPTGGRLKGIIAEMDRNPGAFPSGAVDRLREATPEGRKAADEEAFDRQARKDFDEKTHEKLREQRASREMVAGAVGKGAKAGMDVIKDDRDLHRFAGSIFGAAAKEGAHDVDKAQKDEKRQESEAKAARNAAAATGRDRLSEIDDFARKTLIGDLNRGAGPEAAQRKLVDKLTEVLQEKGHMTEDQARLAAAEIGHDTVNNLRKGHLGRMMLDPSLDQAEARKSEVIGMGELNRKIQSSIGGGDDAKKQLHLMERMVEFQKQIAEARAQQAIAVLN